MKPELLKEYNFHCNAIDQYSWPKSQKRLMKREIRKTLERTGWVDLKNFPAEHRWNLCSERLRSGDFTNWDGWAYRSDWSMTYWFENHCHIPKLDLRKAYREEIKHIVVIGEQGIGDEILFSSVLPELILRAGHKCIEFQCYPRMKTLFERSFKVLCTDRRPLSQVIEGQYVVSLGDLLPLYRRDKDHFPRKAYIKPDPSKVERWKSWLSQFKGKKIGIAWYSRHGVLNPKDLMTEEAFYFDLQYEHEKVKSPPPRLIRPPFDIKNDFENLYAFVSQLDRIQSCTQTLCHVAGSLGKETHAVIPPDNGEVVSKIWYYGQGESSWESPVYPNFTIYRDIHEFRKVLAPN